ncbi:(2Fe-2S)-binding protein [Catenovulum sediminis]|uniref:(2Fe-2S)-binding protein n=1 Tax=Catenovulum sediminis TaxID=1740262 RepID=A0ABV1REF0_9ALTE
MKFNIKVNQQHHSIETDSDMPVLWVLRDLLKMTGTKFGCGKGLCGACTVLFNGQAVRSCSLPISTVGSSEIVTIEKVDKIAEYQKHAIPIKQAWRDFNVPQCGYCQSGQIMSAVAFVKNTPNVNKQQIKSSMTGNICRCGTYPRIEKALAYVIDSKDANDAN